MVLNEGVKIKSLISEAVRRKKETECRGHGIGKKHLPGCQQNRHAGDRDEEGLRDSVMYGRKGKMCFGYHLVVLINQTKLQCWTKG